MYSSWFFSSTVVPVACTDGGQGGAHRIAVWAEVYFVF